MNEKRALRNRVLELCWCLWMVAAQIWYYKQFEALLRNVLRPVLHRLWN